MFNSFPAGSEDTELRLRTFDAVLDGIPGTVINEVAKRFTAGDVEGQNRTFAPTVAEFTQEARRLTDLRSYRNRNLPAIAHHRSEIAPFMVRTEKARTRFAGWSVFKEDVGYDEARNLSKAGQLPVGAVWSGCLATIFLPPVKE